MILGLSTSDHGDYEHQDRMLQEIKGLVGTNVGYIAYEESPPFNSEEFAQLASTAAKTCPDDRTGTRRMK
jgi:hypothetical protein